MNFLAHFYLSGPSDEVKIGNFIGDYVKGNDYLQYSELIREGIITHRKIDTFTDIHPDVRICKILFSPKYHKYSGVLVDVIFDHFLAVNWNKYSSEPFDDYIENLYEILASNFEILPDEVQGFIHRFIEKKWMNGYKYIQGIERVFNGMSKHTSLPDHTYFAMDIFKENYTYLQEKFNAFFPKLIEFVDNESEIISLKKAG
jgi:acyl carrier protein phosphodiesterase